MLINDLKNREEFCDLVVQELREYGIKYRRDKKGKQTNDKGITKKIFYTPLHLMDLTDVILINGGIVQVPRFISDACQIILDSVYTEGLFRKAGSNMRQKEIRLSLEHGQSFKKDYHVIDIANVLKSFFRDLPEPMLPPGNIQESMLRCLLCKENIIETLLMTCLLLPPLTLNTLSYFMQFLQTVSLHSKENKMTIENLAIIFTPGIMPLAEIIGQRLHNHVKIITMLIKNAQNIGVLSETLLKKAETKLGNIDIRMPAFDCDKKKKKRRSGSLTRMFNGFRKIVGAIGSNENLNVTPTETIEEVNTTTPCLNKSAKKRKVVEPQAFSSKKMKEVLKLQPENGSLVPCKQIAIKEIKKSRLSISGKRQIKNIEMKKISESNKEPQKTTVMERRWSFVGAPWNRNKKGNDSKGTSHIEKPLTPVLSLPCLPLTPQAQDEKFSRELFKDDVDVSIISPENGIDEKEYVKISKSEYEAIKERVSAIESRISQEFGNLTCENYPFETSNISEIDGPQGVMSVYEKTLEETGPMIERASTTNQLAKRLSRDLKIRNSLDNKAIRSPSARKIGAVRRKSRDNVNNARLSRNQTWNNEQINSNPTKPKIGNLSTLKRGKPNSIKSGLTPISPQKKDCNNDLENIEWQSADEFFNRNELSKLPASNHETTPASSTEIEKNPTKLTNLETPKFVSCLVFGELLTPMPPPIVPPRKTPGNFKTPIMYSHLSLKNPLSEFQEQQTGRESIARIRCQNAGMVMAKAKLFDGMSTVTNNMKSKPVETPSPTINSTPRRKNTSKSPGRISRHRQRALMLKSPIIMKAIKDEYLTEGLSSEKYKIRSRNNIFSSPKIKRELKLNSPNISIKTPSKEHQFKTPMRATPNNKRSSPRIMARNAKQN